MLLMYFVNIDAVNHIWVELPRSFRVVKGSDVYMHTFFPAKGFSGLVFSWFSLAMISEYMAYMAPPCGSPFV